MKPRSLPARILSSRTTAAMAAAAVSAALLLAGCGHYSVAQPAAPGKVKTAPSPTKVLPTGAPTTVCSNGSRLAAWSNRRLAMLTIAVPAAESASTDVSEEVAAGAGGVLLFGTAAPKSLGSDLSVLRAHVPGRLGLLVMTDEEGGGIQRMANLVGSLPWPSWMGAHWSAAQIRTAVGQVGARMAAAGVNMDLAPVADVDGRDVAPGTDPDGWRSFSGDSAVAAQDTVAFMDGLRTAGVIPVLKHFPGLGGSSGNSDLGPARSLPWSVESGVGLPPFTAAIAAGAPAVMVSNDTVPGLATNPGGLSPTTISQELEGGLRFHGLVVTDSLTAGAVSGAGFTVPQAAVQALRSGADMVMFGLVRNVAGETSAIADAVVEAVAEHHLDRARLIAAAGAVLAVRHVDLCRG